jgi:Ca2+-binding RTX toxin-like protein
MVPGHSCRLAGKLGAGHDYALTLDNMAVTIGHSLQVDGSALLAGDVLLFDGTDETTSTFFVTGGAADDILYGGAAQDLFDLTHGGQDSVNGGSGNDIFVFGATYNNDNVDGGDGNDLMVLDGDYSGGNAAFIGGDGYASIERIVLEDGNSYGIDVADDGIPPDGRLTIDGSRLGASDDIALDISDVDGGTVSTARIKFEGGAGDDVVTARRLVTADRLDGGGGNNTMLLSGDTAVVLKDATVQNFTTMQFSADADYSVVTGRHLIGDGRTLKVDGSVLGVADSLNFDGSREVTGGFAFKDGAGDDILSGGRGDDTFDLTHGGDDIARGGRGINTFNLGGTFTPDASGTLSTSDFI